MKENIIRSMELGVGATSCYLSSITMVNTTLYAKLIEKIAAGSWGEILGDYIGLLNYGITITALALCIFFWRKGDEIWLGRLFSLNMLMYFPALLDYSSFNWLGLMINLPGEPGVSGLWVFGVGMLLQVNYLLLRYTVRFRYTRVELLERGADPKDIDQVSGGQMSYLFMLTSLTAAVTTGIFLAVPRIEKAISGSLSGLPAPHLTVGLIVVVMISTALIFYLRGARQQPVRVEPPEIPVEAPSEDAPDESEP